MAGECLRGVGSVVRGARCLAVWAIRHFGRGIGVVLVAHALVAQAAAGSAVASFGVGATVAGSCTILPQPIVGALAGGNTGIAACSPAAGEPPATYARAVTSLVRGAGGKPVALQITF